MAELREEMRWRGVREEEGRRRNEVLIEEVLVACLGALGGEREG